MRSFVQAFGSSALSWAPDGRLLAAGGPFGAARWPRTPAELSNLVKKCKETIRNRVKQAKKSQELGKAAKTQMQK